MGMTIYRYKEDDEYEKDQQNDNIRSNGTLGNNQLRGRLKLLIRNLISKCFFPIVFLYLLYFTISVFPDGTTLRHVHLFFFYLFYP